MNIKLKSFLLIIAVLFSVEVFSQDYIMSDDYYSYNEDIAGSGIKKVCIFKSLTGVTLKYESTALSVNFYSYRYSISDKELVTDVSPSSSGGVTTYTLSNLVDSRGYMVEEDGVLKAAVWIIDYGLHQPVFTSIDVVESEDKCENIKLYVTKSDELSFYTNGGAKRDVKRKYTIHYDNQVWNEDNLQFENKEVVVPEREVGAEVLVSAPLKDTKFVLQGDQFAKYFGVAKQLESAAYSAISVKAHIVTVQEKRNVANEKKTEGSDLGGSAPVTINFYGHGNEPVVDYYTWLIYNSRDMNNPVDRYTDQDIKYTFEESGDFVVKLEVAGRSSMCIDTASVSFNISISSLDIPNYFSPGDSPGSNDEFRVAYKSLVKFKCTIFNRWGKKLYEWSDPAKGWDGKYNGRYVTTGVYFYVIEALGSDGIRYKRGGDINVLRGR
ncbi:gliding motility-associated C-terminal domain-containing protein [Dysgonomonas sp. BGC7]|uniref:T9SS type B sorting domain-containing protein n=1 Tax=Dysgonomonas sp. BGC7 TaxID=1658008 RepID=UPI0006810906|nr:gliding motility-associated C-terminal domain-containing protein [Dysgonomonas sp. BGC7]MBD8389521.1 gliding motility-associated C-terminal domain-containing protein [Dysgonomonas sp. BGC7]